MSERCDLASLRPGQHPEYAAAGEPGEHLQRQAAGTRGARQRIHPEDRAHDAEQRADRARAGDEAQGTPRDRQEPPKRRRHQESDQEGSRDQRQVGPGQAREVGCGRPQPRGEIDVEVSDFIDRKETANPAESSYPLGLKPAPLWEMLPLYLSELA